MVIIDPIIRVGMPNDGYKYGSVYSSYSNRVGQSVNYNSLQNTENGLNSSSQGVQDMKDRQDGLSQDMLNKTNTIKQ